MNKLMLFFIGFITSYLVVSYNITTMGLFATSMLVSVTFALLYAGYMGYLKVQNNETKEVKDKELVVWLNNVDQMYKKTENIDTRLSNPIFSHNFKSLLEEREKYFNTALKKIMFGYHLEI